MNQPNDGSVSQFIRQRRIALRLKQAAIAAELRVEPETVGHWENGRRRMELDKVPRVAAILQLNKKDLCRMALFEWHPRLYATLFGTEPPRQPRCLETFRPNDESGRDAITSGDTGSGPLEVGVIVCHGLREAEKLA
jgi:transcriptional regulator with XRE-family HTH domain